MLLHDAEGAIVSIELKNGAVYRGILSETQDNMNCTIKNCSKIGSDGRESIIEMAFVRGSSIKFIVLPDVLSKAPFFNRVKLWKKFKGHAVFGVNTAIGGPRGQTASILKKTQQKPLIAAPRPIGVYPVPPVPISNQSMMPPMMGYPPR
eukprot:gene18002-23640_t